MKLNMKIMDKLKPQDINAVLSQYEYGSFSEACSLLSRLKRLRKLFCNLSGICLGVLLILLAGLLISTKWNHPEILVAIAVSFILGTQWARYGWTLNRVRKAIVKANKVCTSQALSAQLMLLEHLEEFRGLFNLHTMEIAKARTFDGDAIEISRAAEEVIMKYSLPPAAEKFSSHNLNHYTFMTRVVPVLYSSHLLSTSSKFADTIKTSAEKLNYSSIQNFFQQANSNPVSVPKQNECNQSEHPDKDRMMNSSKLWKHYHFHSTLNTHLSQIAGVTLGFIVVLILFSSMLESHYDVYTGLVLASFLCSLFCLFLVLINSKLKAFIPLARISQILMKYALTGQISMLGSILDQLNSHRGHLNSSYIEDLKSSTIMLMAQVNDETSTSLTQVQRRILERMLVNDKYLGNLSYPNMSHFTKVTSSAPLKVTHYAAHALGYLGNKNSMEILLRIVKRTKDITLQQICEDAIVRLNHKLEVADSYLLRSSQISNSSKDLLSISSSDGDTDQNIQSLYNRSSE